MADKHIVEILNHAPLVECPGCQVNMTLRHLDPKDAAHDYTALYRCPKCGTETQREFTAPTA